MRIGYFLILTIALISIYGCQVNSQEKSQATQNNQTNQNEQKIAGAAAKTESLKLKLNNEEAGTTENTSALSNKLETIFKYREKEGAFRPGSNEIEKSVYLAADRSASAEEIAKLFRALKNAGASPIMIPVPVKTAGLPRPNPFFLVVYAGSGEYKRSGNEIKEITLDGADSEKDETFDDIKGIEIGFTGEASDGILIAVSKDGIYTLDGKQISKDELKTAIENSLKSKDNDEKTISVQAENYGNMEDIAKIADSAGAVKVNFITKKQ